MASPLMIFTAERHWTEDKERALIAFFSKHSCLWNHKSESYKNKQLRWETLEQLRILLSAHPPPVPFTVEDIKSKFKNLRTTFQRQSKLAKAMKQVDSEQDFVPQWKYYEQLMFLQGSWDQDDDPGPSPPSLLTSCAPQEVSQQLAAAASSSYSPSPARCYWTEEQERALISFYSEHSCLWNKKSENHSNRQLRLRLFEALRSQLLAEHSGSFSVEDVKYKFKNLRTVFSREHKAVQASRASETPHVSKWKHYQQLLFLSESCDEDDGVESYRDRAAEQGAQTSSCSFQADVEPGGGFQIFDSASPDHVKTAADSIPPSPVANDSLLGLSPSCVLQADRPGADGHCLWSDAKVQQLISFFSEHSGLWDRRAEGYQNRPLRQSLLETLSRLLSDGERVAFTVDDIKTKFRNLRTIFQREHKVVRTNRICGSEDFYMPKWKHYQQLMFLCDSCDEDEEPEGPGLLRLDRRASALPPHQSPLSKTPSDSQHSSPAASPSPSPSISSNPASRRRTAPSGDEVLDLLKALCQNQQASPHAGFLKYVEECLNDTPPGKVRRLKKRIIETIHSASEEG
ncbi:uncharacterized protein LOC115383492 [Salarias fasciatus]|uniref:uncharacterized protein LOC115383492 n=1 Tax=Salarias fasciatus TaxID=181472 RepID=UPI00117679A1|nr:uncharacterized protein LOC115383492 [Salarias fasciatus]